MNETERNLKQGIHPKGFTVMEVLVSLVLVLMVLLGVLRMISAAFDGYRNAGEAFRMYQRMDEFRSRMLSESFDSIKWQTGEYNLQDQWFDIKWSIRHVTPGLKVVRLRFIRKRNGVTRSSSFYKSRHIKAGW